jgi:hypothetical protein
VGNVLAALRSVEVWRLGVVLDVPRTKWEELKGQSANDEEWRERLVQYFLQTHPLAGWGLLGGTLLWWGHPAAVEEVKVHIVPEEGMNYDPCIHVAKGERVSKLRLACGG